MYQFLFIKLLGAASGGLDWYSVHLFFTYGSMASLVRTYITLGKGWARFGGAKLQITIVNSFRPRSPLDLCAPIIFLNISYRCYSLHT
jgi:hypothetical protein